MHRLEKAAKNGSELLKGKRVVITGCGYRPVGHVFHDVISGEATHDSFFIGQQEMKMNIGMVTAGVLAMEGAYVHMVSSSPEKLAEVKKALLPIVRNKNLIEYSAVNLTRRDEISSFVRNLPRELPIYWVQSLGLGAGSYKIKDDNPYLPLEEIPSSLLSAELEVTKSTLDMVQELIPIFRTQHETRAAMVTSMSGIRSYIYGGAHCTAKAAINQLANQAMHELYADNIYVTAIRPGAIDTGTYDSPEVRNAVSKIARTYGCDWTTDRLRLAPPMSVAESIKLCLTVPAHITSINLVARGQFPHEGS